MQEVVNKAFSDLYSRAPIKKSTGLELEFDDTGYATFILERTTAFDHAMGDVHGGMIATMLDNTGWFTVAAKLNRAVLTADLTIRLLAPAGQQTLRATSEVVRLGKRQAVVNMFVHNEDGKLVATGSGGFSVVSPEPFCVASK